MKKRHSGEQIVGILRQADVLLGKGQKVPEVCKQLGISEQTWQSLTVACDYSGAGAGRTTFSAALANEDLPVAPVPSTFSIGAPSHGRLPIGMHWPYRQCSLHADECRRRQLAPRCATKESSDATDNPLPSYLSSFPIRGGYLRAGHIRAGRPGPTERNGKPFPT